MKTKRQLFSQKFLKEQRENYINKKIMERMRELFHVNEKFGDRERIPL